MSGFFKKLIATGAVLTVGLASVAFADRACCPPPDCGSCANWCDNFSVEASWLLWKVNGDEFDFAVDKTRTTTAVTDGSVYYDSESIHDLKFDWDSGFRLGFGFDMPNMGWGVNLNWTHFDTKSTKHENVIGTTGNTTTYVNLPSVQRFGATLATGDSALFKGHEKFGYNVVDLEMGKWCCCGSSCVMFRPHIGFRFADINETFDNSVAFSGTTESESSTAATSAELQAKNRFKGAGVRAGLDTDLCLCDGWSFIGRGAASLIWGTTHLKNNFGYSTGTIAGLYDGEIKEHYRNTRLITDLSFGIRYKTCLCGCYPVYAEFAWEHHYLFNQHRFWVDNSFYPSTYATSSWKKNGSVALQGFTFTAGLDF